MIEFAVHTSWFKFAVEPDDSETQHLLMNMDYDECEALQEEIKTKFPQVVEAYPGEYGTIDITIDGDDWTHGVETQWVQELRRWCEERFA